VPKEEPVDEVWGSRFVSETAVTSRIKQACRALGDDGQAHPARMAHRADMAVSQRWWVLQSVHVDRFLRALASP
jgi:hypothetical protein